MQMRSRKLPDQCTLKSVMKFGSRKWLDDRMPRHEQKLKHTFPFTLNTASGARIAERAKEFQFSIGRTRTDTAANLGQQSR